MGPRRVGYRETGPSYAIQNRTHGAEYIRDGLRLTNKTTGISTDLYIPGADDQQRLLDVIFNRD